MIENFPSAILNLREWEGFKDNDPDDPGGETQYGISRHYHPYMWGKDGTPPTWEQAEAFYLRLWVSMRCNTLPFPVDCLHFDASVNPGPGASREFLRQSGEHKNPYRRATEYAILRLRYYNRRAQARPKSLKYIVGWSDRTLDFIERTIITKWSLEEI